MNALVVKEILEELEDLTHTLHSKANEARKDSGLDTNKYRLGEASAYTDAASAIARLKFGIKVKYPSQFY